MKSVQIDKNSIEAQRDRVFGEQPELKLVSPCKLGEGIINSDEEQR